MTNNANLSDLVMLPRTLTAENGAKALLSGEFAEHDRLECPECIEHGSNDTCETCSGNGYVTIDVPVSWITIKAIYKKIVEHYETNNPTGKAVNHATKYELFNDD